MEVDQEVVFPPDRHDHTDCFFFIHKSCGRNMAHKKFREVLVRDLVIQSHKANVTDSQWCVSRQANPIFIPTQPTGSQTIATMAFQRQAKALSCVFLEGKEQQTSCITVRSAMLVCASWTALRNGIRM
jgi:hypothetical protein